MGDPTRPIPAGRYILRLDLLDPTGLPLTEGTDLGLIPVTVPERQFTVSSISRPMGLRLGETATLLGYDLGTTALRAGETLTLTLYWRSDRPTEQSYTVSVHLVGPDGRIYAQRDLPPVGGVRPTTG